MKIPAESLWENIGEMIVVPDDILWEGDNETVNLPKGTYQIIEVTNFGMLFFDVSKNRLVSTETIFDETFTSIPTPPNERLELLEDALTKQIIQLLADGWRPVKDPTKYDLDITPFTEKLGVIKALRNVKK